MEIIDVCCMELMALRRQACSLEAGVFDLEKLVQRESFGEETLRDLPEQFHFCADSSSE